MTRPRLIKAPRGGAGVERDGADRVPSERRALGAVVALAIPGVLGLVLLGRPAIRIHFEHGRFGP